MGSLMTGVGLDELNDEQGAWDDLKFEDREANRKENDDQLRQKALQNLRERRMRLK
jgi:hypothetical protein